MNADEIDVQIRMLAAERRLPPSHLARWLAMDPASRAAMLDIARVIRLRTGQLMTALETLEEIAVQEQIRAEVAALKLPGGISIVLPKELASDEFTVSLRVRSAAELAHLLEALDRSRPGLARIIEMLAGKK